LLGVAFRGIVQLLSSHCNNVRRTGLDNAYDNHRDYDRSPPPQLQPIVSRLGAGGCALLVWLEKAAWLEDDGVGTGRTRTESVRRLQPWRVVKFFSHHNRSNSIDCHRNRYERPSATNHQLYAHGAMMLDLPSLQPV
jgi:hypothetical protein